MNSAEESSLLMTFCLQSAIGTYSELVTEKSRTYVVAVNSLNSKNDQFSMSLSNYNSIIINYN